MKTPNQTDLGGFIFRMSKLIIRPVALVQSLAIILAALAATAQTRPVATATNAAVSTAEVTAFMQAPNGVFEGSPDPKRVPLLLAAIEREPAGPVGQTSSRHTVSVSNMPVLSGCRRADVRRFMRWPSNT